MDILNEFKNEMLHWKIEYINKQENTRKLKESKKQ